jgi:alkaline phosphatase
MRDVYAHLGVNRKVTKHKTNKTNKNMKKYIIIAAAAIVASFGVTYAANSFRSVEDHSKCDSVRCTICDGTGWKKNSPFKCAVCNGSGSNGSY